MTPEQRLDRLRLVLNPRHPDDQQPVLHEDLAWLVADYARLQSAEKELSHWRRMFSSPDVARKAFERMRDVIDEALGEDSTSRSDAEGLEPKGCADASVKGGSVGLQPRDEKMTES